MHELAANVEVINVELLVALPACRLIDGLRGRVGDRR
jgi:hypothetical protein